MEGRNIAGNDVLVGVAVSTRVGVVMFMWTGSGVILSTVGPLAVADRGVGGTSKARKPFETGDRKIMIETRAAKIANKKKESNTQKPVARASILWGFEDRSGGVFSAGGIS